MWHCWRDRPPPPPPVFPDHLRQQHPALFAKLYDPPPPPVVDAGILKRIEPVVDRAALRPARKAMDAIKRLISGGNYCVNLDLKAVKLPDWQLPITEVMVACYPNSRPDPADVRRVSAAEMRADVEACLGFESESISDSLLTAAERARLEAELIPAYWRGLSQLIDPDAADFFAYPGATGLPGYPGYWFFAYLIHAGWQCVVVTGSASD